MIIKKRKHHVRKEKKINISILLSCNIYVWHVVPATLNCIMIILILDMKRWENLVASFHNVVYLNHLAGGPFNFLWMASLATFIQPIWFLPIIFSLYFHNHLSMIFHGIMNLFISPIIIFILYIDDLSLTQQTETYIIDQRIMSHIAELKK